ncbi:GAF domain-containing protein [Nonlabens xiamenensis]|uniref:GAF domain-containing protein n=1 Tax=Nonlabens xiamenensis TaxID=2341043 RepID=UPI000F6114F9|nr:GAF domain-containing protein [Nonlabens xiamenensis]
MKGTNQNTNTVDMKVVLTFKKVVEQYEKRLEYEKSNFKKLYISSVLRYAEDHEALVDGILPEDIFKYEESVSVLLSDLFPAALTMNEIKAATVPFSDLLFNKTKRLENILDAAGPDFEFSIRKMEDGFDLLRMKCGIILNKFYGKIIDISRPMFCEIPDATGALRTYRITYNADFVDVLLNDQKLLLTDSDIKNLLRQPENESLWKQYFPENAYTFEGFGIISFTDVTMDKAISDLKTILLDYNNTKNDQTKKIETIFKNMFNLDQLRVGFTAFDNYDRTFETMVYNNPESFILGESHEKTCENALCADSYKHLIEDYEPLVITDVASYAADIENKFLTDNLQRKGVESAILYPIAKGTKLIGVLEIVSRKKFALNSFNAMKIDAVANYIKAALVRTEQENENRIKALIQTECTSIHPSVQWKFEREARRLIKARNKNKATETFKDVRFPDIHPLYGQIDIVGSSDARNNSIKEDLINQLKIVSQIFAQSKEVEPLPIYDQISYRVEEYYKELEDGFIDANSEREIIKLLTEEINPIMKHLVGLSPEIKEMVYVYQQDLDPTSGVIYANRNNYDRTVQSINEALSTTIDRRQKEAQQIFPHYFERFKTDGVEHNIYVGPSIANEMEFNIVYLYNLRLWQLQTMIEMENQFYTIQEDLPTVIEAASMILVFDNTLSIRYRIDEKRFDVDGTYNARYEVIKKRIDKANIKNTNERITQKGKIAIIYTNKETEREYMRYINFLQHKKMLGAQVENLELEDVQGVVGLKALRVNILYNTESSKGTLSYDDLVKELHL